MPRPRKKPMDKSPLSLSISALTHEGRGLAEHQGKKIFVFGALPGETVSAERTATSSRFEEAKTLSLESQPSPLRVEAACPHFEVCGGCSLQHMAHPAQIEHKQASLLEMLAQEKVVPDTVLEPVLGPVWGYRHKARLGVKFIEKKGTLALGFRERGTNKLALMDRCLVLHPALERLIPLLKALLLSMDALKDIPQIEVAMGECPALVLRHMQALSDGDRDKLVNFAKDENLWIYSQSGGPNTVKRLYPEGGDEKLIYEIPAFDIRYEFHPLDFTQINPVVNQQMVQLAVDALDPKANEVVLDLFSGLGNFSLPLARRSYQVIGVEGSEEMTQRAKENAARHGLDNTEFYAANLAENCAEMPWAKQAHKVLIDPPRSGAWEVLDWLPKLKVSRIVYVSCNPATLARDAGRLVKEWGYRCKSVRILDMFPHTSHVESLAVFEREG